MKAGKVNMYSGTRSEVGCRVREFGLLAIYCKLSASCRIPAIFVESAI